jgi:hypothetical protein
MMSGMLNFSSLIVISAILFSAQAFAVPSSASLGPNVILITLDGARYHEIFQGVQKPRLAGEPRGTALLPKSMAILRRDGLLFGDRMNGESSMIISNKIGISQPGYRAILSGQFERECRGNNCGVIEHETLLDRLIDDGFEKKSVASFASWDVIDRCLESKGARGVRSVAFDDLKGLSPEESAPFDAIQKEAITEKPEWHGSRSDHHTFEMGLLYLKTFRPRFLYLSFVESDEYAHLGDYPGYLRSLREFDDRYLEILETLKAMDAYGEDTSIVVTTDHGRGRGFLWTKHSKEWIDARKVWATILPSPRLRSQNVVSPVQKDRYHQTDIRPTVEVLLGLKPRPKVKGRGESMIQFSPKTSNEKSRRFKPE